MHNVLHFLRCVTAGAIAAAGLSIAAAPAEAATITVSGTVLDPDGNPVAGAEIWDGQRDGFISGDGAFAGFCEDRMNREDLDPLATTDASGAFTFTCDSTGVFVYAADPDGRYVNAKRYVSSSTSGIELELGALPSESMSVRGVVLDPDGVPISGAGIWDMYDGDSGGMCAEVGRMDLPRAVSRADGSFRVACHPADGSLQLLATLTGRDFQPNTAAEWYRVDTVGASLRFFRKYGAVTGRIFGPTHAPIIGTDVVLLGNCRVECARTTTRLPGRYLFENLAPYSEYCIRYEDYPDLDEPCFTATEDTLVLADQQVTEQFTGTLRGKVLGIDGSPIPGADVHVLQADKKATTDAAGVYVIRGLPPIDWDVRVYATDYNSEKTTVYIRRDETTRHTFKLDPIPPPVDHPPSGYFTFARTEGKLNVGGMAEDDSGVATARVGVQDLATKKWLHADGTWGAYQQLPAALGTPGSRLTDWHFRRTAFPSGRYGISLVLVDSAGQRNVEPRPWHVVTVTTQ